MLKVLTFAPVDDEFFLFVCTQTYPVDCLARFMVLGGVILTFCQPRKYELAFRSFQPTCNSFFSAGQVWVTPCCLLVFIRPALTCLYPPVVILLFVFPVFISFLFSLAVSPSILDSFFLSFWLSLGPPSHRDQVICLLAPGCVQGKQWKRGLNIISKIVLCTFLGQSLIDILISMYMYI